MKFDLFKEKEKENSAGPFEVLLMTAVQALGDNAYSYTIQAKLEQMTGKKENMGKIYVVLERMNEKGYVGARMVEGGPLRGGHKRRYYRLLPPGAAALHAAMSTSQRAIEELEESGFFKLWKRKLKLKRV